MTLNWTIQQIFGGLLIFTSIFDAIKYSIQSRRIWKKKSAESMSRRFINYALSNDIVKFCYGIVIVDWYIIASSVLALICMLDLWYAIFYWYPYRMRGCPNFKRPNILLYFINSTLPNRIRRRL